MTPVISDRNLETSFGSVVAARDINVEIPALQTVGIIGANGAGKTTFVNMITGHITPSSGSIWFSGKDVTGLPSRTICRMGISRSFQVAQIFPSLTVYENMCAAAAIARNNVSVLRFAVMPLLNPEAEAETEEAIDLFQLKKYRDAPAATLPQGVRKLLDIAMAVAGRPQVLLLDEPTSGISVEEKYDLMEIVMAALKSRKVTVLFVEHDMELVDRFAERVLAFYDGTVISDGAPAEVLGDPRVQELITGHALSKTGSAVHA